MRKDEKTKAGVRKAVACAAIAAVAAVLARADGAPRPGALGLALSLNGDVRVGETGAKLRMVIFHEGWTGSTRGAVRAGRVSFDVGDVSATVWATALDGRPIARSGRILVSHLTDVQADGATYADRERTLVFSCGWTPIIVRNGRAKVSLAVADAAAFEVWALETDGRRAERVPCDVRDGRLCFTADVKGAGGARMLYEAVKGK